MYIPGNHSGGGCVRTHHAEADPHSALPTAAPVLVLVLHLCPRTAEYIPPSVVRRVATARAFRPADPAPILAASGPLIVRCLARHVVAPVVLLGWRPMHHNDLSESTHCTSGFVADQAAYARLTCNAGRAS